MFFSGDLRYCITRVSEKSEANIRKRDSLCAWQGRLHILQLRENEKLSPEDTLRSNNLAASVPKKYKSVSKDV